MDEKDAIEVLSRERVEVRSRGNGVTLAAWRLSLALPGGKQAAIVFAEPWYRGEGALLGATQERLAELWRATPPPDEAPPDLQQWG
jgi:hypothetical protein